MKPECNEGYPVFRHTTLLVVLVATIMLEPLVGSGLTMAVFLAVMVVVAALLDGGQRRTKVAIGIMGFPALILFAAQFLSSDSPWRTVMLEGRPALVYRVLLIAALAFCGWLLLSSLLRARRVSANEILGAISLYIILAFIWSFTYGLLEQTRPGSFGLINPAGQANVSMDDRKENATQFIYFSFVTQTTLGFGDIIPHSSLARRLVILQAVMGQFYIAVVVAYLISLFIMQHRE